MVVTLAAAEQVAVILVIKANVISQEVCDHKKCTNNLQKMQILSNNNSKIT